MEAPAWGGAKHHTPTVPWATQCIESPCRWMQRGVPLYPVTARPHPQRYSLHTSGVETTQNRTRNFASLPSSQPGSCDGWLHDMFGGDSGLGGPDGLGARSSSSQRGEKQGASGKYVSLENEVFGQGEPSFIEGRRASASLGQSSPGRVACPKNGITRGDPAFDTMRARGGEQTSTVIPNRP